MGLPGSLLDICHGVAYSVLVCDIALILVNRDFSIRELCDVSNVPDVVEFVGDRLHVTFVDGAKETFGA